MIYMINITELRQQLIRLETLTERIPPLVIKDIVEICQSEYDTQRDALERDFIVRMKQIDAKRVRCISGFLYGCILLDIKLVLCN